MDNPEREWFGHEKVSPEEKTGRVRGVFDSVTERYDLMNDLMSGGLHHLWKNRLVREVCPQPGLRYLDVAGGTGDIAFRIHQKTRSPVTVLDLNENMLSHGRDRALNRGWTQGFSWITGNAESLPFPDNSFDVYTIAFGLRNVTHIDDALKEAYRVLDQGGHFYCLEFSHVRNPLLKRAYALYSDVVLPKLGRHIANDEDSYRYLVESIRRFPRRAQLKQRMEKAGLEHTRIIDLSAGIVAIHSGMKR